MASLCRELGKSYTVHVITAHTSSAIPNEPGVNRAPWPGLLAFTIYALWRGAVFLAGDRQIRVVFGGSAMVTPLVLILARMFRRRAVVLTHGLDVIYSHSLYQLLCVRWLKLCDRVIANSHCTASLARSKGVAQQRIVVISPGIHPERFAIHTDVITTKMRWNVEDKKIILFVGRLAKRKGIKEFLEFSLVEIVKEVPDAVFLIVGDNPTESLAHHENVMDEIDRIVSRLRLEAQVRVLGALSDDEVVKLYQASDLVVLPALEMKDDVEGFGISALEAAAAGKPVVATSVGGVPDAVDEGKSGALVHPGDYAALSRKVIELLTDDAKRFSLGAYAGARAHREFSWRQIAESYVGVFASLD
jgi:phosphatidyl-myo-inositol dimannoside synthase